MCREFPRHKQDMSQEWKAIQSPEWKEPQDACTHNASKKEC